mmetsp:Transcript_21868/g.75203  ORF Transcript_21868/g.75203 Transcript_21868/m.75203 type:complete len:209 (+) Transcript_21868:1312-1938(+)
MALRSRREPSSPAVLALLMAFALGWGATILLRRTTLKPGAMVCVSTKTFALRRLCCFPAPDSTPAPEDLLSAALLRAPTTPPALGPFALDSLPSAWSSALASLPDEAGGVLSNSPASKAHSHSQSKSSLSPLSWLTLYMSASCCWSSQSSSGKHFFASPSPLSHFISRGVSMKTLFGRWPSGVCQVAQQWSGVTASGEGLNSNQSSTG